MCGGGFGEEGLINDVSFIVFGRTPSEVHALFQSASILSHVRSGGKGSSAVTEVTKKNPVNFSTLRCFLCESEVAGVGRVVATWETVEERQGKSLKMVVSMVLNAKADADKRTCIESPTIRFHSDITLSDYLGGNTEVRRRCYKYENSKPSIPIVIEQWVNDENSAMSDKWSAEGKSGESPGVMGMLASPLNLFR